MKADELKSTLEAGGKATPFWIVGPCVLEEEATVMKIAETIQAIHEKHHIPVVFKASFDKANRTHVASPRGPGLDHGLRVLEKVKRSFSFPLLTDVHETHQVSAAAEVVDILQVPAFLSRQTDLLLAVATAERCVNVKKGQFMSPDDVQHILGKLRSKNCTANWITERGVSFGYQRLVVDFSGFPLMESHGADLIFDCTHSVQLPSSNGGVTGGNRAAIPSLARAAAAVGVKGFFAETHPNPVEAWSDASNAWPLDRLEELILSTNEVAYVAHGD